MKYYQYFIINMFLFKYSISENCLMKTMGRENIWAQTIYIALSCFEVLAWNNKS